MGSMRPILGPTSIQVNLLLLFVQCKKCRGKEEPNLIKYCPLSEEKAGIKRVGWCSR